MEEGVDTDESGRHDRHGEADEAGRDATDVGAA